MKKNSKNSNDNQKRRLPRPLVFGVLFAGSFLPNMAGKVFAALAGLVLALYVLSLMHGKKRYLLAIVLPVLACITVRFASHGTYMCITDSRARDAAAGKVQAAAHYAAVFFNTIGRYASRLWETVWSVRDAFTGFLHTGKFQCLEPAAENLQFILILLAMLVCIIAVFRNRRPA
jgi:hypothetical protein